MKLNFYNVFLEQNGEKTRLSLNTLLDHINNQTAIGRTLKLDDDCYYSMPRYNQVDNQCRVFWIGKFLKEKPYNGHVGTDEIEEIIGDVYQPVICLYDEAYGLLAIESSLMGPTRKTVEAFLNAYISNLDDGNTDDYEVALIQQKSEAGLNIINAQTEILRIWIQIHVEGVEMDNLFVDDNQQQNLLQTILHRNTDFATDCNANVMSLELKKGRYNGNLNGTIIALMEAINSEDTHLISGLVDVKLGNGEKTTIDLKGKKNLVFYKNVGDITGFDALTVILKDARHNNEFPEEARYYALNHYDHDMIDCNGNIDYRDIPYGGYVNNEIEEP
ncbi:hypothetical protein [Lactiplantibacillus plantarum]|uniref:hypothetical protein n=1 Tax=Lactiplantibacillus plantarum TaxID=1590 RepID=UPI002FE55C97